MIDQQRRYGVRTYVLDADGNLIPEPDSAKWADWHSDLERRRIALDQVGDVEVSTVFFGISTCGCGMFETMTFSRPGHPWNERQWRHHTRDEALQEHQRVCGEIRSEYE